MPDIQTRQEKKGNKKYNKPIFSQKAVRAKEAFLEGTLKKSKTSVSNNKKK
jgi:hypothetical protein